MINQNLAPEEVDTQVAATAQPTGLLVQGLEYSLTDHSEIGYTHRLLRQQADLQAELIEQLRERIQAAHADAKKYLRKAAKESLDPTGLQGYDPAQGYPELLPSQALKGYFGEILASIVAIEFSHFGVSGWHVPVYPFRFHQTAFDYLERLREGMPPQRAVLGRTGNDMVAFLMNDNQEIVGSLVCEAKCIDAHSKTVVAKAHQQISDPAIRPLEVRRLATILQEYDDAEAVKWRRALIMLYCSEPRKDYERCDLICYVCGRLRQDSESWLPADRPHEEYKGGRKLECAEIQLRDLDNLVQVIYGTR